MTAQEAVAGVGRGIDVCYQQTGDPADPPIVLIAGLGQQLHSWPDDFVSALAGRGYRVTRFDNRAAGRSTHMRFPPPNPVAMFRGGDTRRQYHLGDMARDTVGLLDALGYSDAHLIGISQRADCSTITKQCEPASSKTAPKPPRPMTEGGSALRESPFTAIGMSSPGCRSRTATSDRFSMRRMSTIV